MAITKKWEINTLNRELADGYVTEVIYRVKGMDGEEEKARVTGGVFLEKPETLIPYKDLTESIVLGWVKDKLKSEKDPEGKTIDRVAEIEKSLEDKINLINTPVSAQGTPW